MDQAKSSLRCFTQKDVIPNALHHELIAVIGYGHLGKPFAMNLRDSGVQSLFIGNASDVYGKQAREDGFTVHTIRDATAMADIVLALLPDEVLHEVFPSEIAPFIKPGAAIMFASGYNLAYDLITLPTGVDILMLAPRMAGENARQRYLEHRGFYAFLSVEQEASGRAWKRLLGLAEGVGVLQAAGLELDARREANLDLLVEQTLGAALGIAIMNIFSLGVEAGIPPEVMVFEMYMDEEMELVWRAFREQGFMRSSNAHGPTAMFGGFLRTMQLFNSDLTRQFQDTLAHIQSGEFAKQFQAERAAGYPILSQAQGMITDEHPITQAEQSLRRLLDQS